jgi:hypothetical protein
MMIEPMSRPDPAHDDAHDLLPAWLAATVPALYATEGEADPIVHVKLFTPDSSWTWYLTEYSPVAPDGTPCLAFGLACGHEDELGYVSLDELRAVRGHLGLQVERDLWWQATPLSQVQSGKVR